MLRIVISISLVLVLLFADIYLILLPEKITYVILIVRLIAGIVIRFSLTYSVQLFRLYLVKNKLELYRVEYLKNVLFEEPLESRLQSDLNAAINTYLNPIINLVIDGTSVLVILSIIGIKYDFQKLYLVLPLIILLYLMIVKISKTLSTKVSQNQADILEWSKIFKANITNSVKTQNFSFIQEQLNRRIRSFSLYQSFALLVIQILPITLEFAPLAILFLISASASHESGSTTEIFATAGLLSIRSASSIQRLLNSIPMLSIGRHYYSLLAKSSSDILSAQHRYSSDLAKKLSGEGRFILTGFSGSGKSVFAKQIVIKNPNIYFIDQYVNVPYLSIQDLYEKYRSKYSLEYINESLARFELHNDNKKTKVSLLSGGQKLRLLLVDYYLDSSSDSLCIDEAVAAVDSRLFSKLIGRIEGKTIIIISHVIQELEGYESIRIEDYAL